jgi:hypothetical protein
VEHDRVAVDDAIDGIDLGCAVVEDADASRGCGGEEIPTLGGAEVLEPGPCADHGHRSSGGAVALMVVARATPVGEKGEGHAR